MGDGQGTLSGLALWALVILCAVLSGLGDVVIFHWARGQGAWALAAGLALWGVSLTLMGYLFRHGTLSFSVAIVLLIVVHLLIDVVWDVTILGTRLSIWQWLGVALAGGSVLLLQFGKASE